MLYVFSEHKKIIGLVLDIQVDDFGIKFILGVWKDREEEYLSIGFEALQFEKNEKSRILKSINIIEVSLVSFPSQEVQKCNKHQIL